MNRRRFLTTLGGAAGAGMLDGCADILRRPRIVEAQRVALSAIRRLVIERSDPVSGRSHYVAETGQQRIAKPVLVARTGETLDAVIENRLPQPTTVHFHGLVLPESEDGAGFKLIAPGATRSLRFSVFNRSGLYWLHPHPHGLTAEQVYCGLAGLLVVTDDDDAAVDRALELAPANRLALAVGDARVADEVVLPYAPDVDECLHGWFGNRALVNGRLDARFDVAPGWVRMQLLNACNARGLLLALRDDRGTVPFHLLGTDGGLLATPLALERVFLYPAERIDVAIALSGRRSVSAVSLAFDARHQMHGAVPSMRHPMRERYPPLAAAEVCAEAARSSVRGLPDGAELPLFALDVGDGKAAMPPLPSRLSALQEAGGASPVTRRVRLDFDEAAGFLIDQRRYHVDEVAFEVDRGRRETWEIRNSPISMPHPMHLHGPGFRVLRRQGTFGPARALASAGSGRLPTDLGLKDTVVLWPNETVWLAVDFKLPDARAFVGRQRYMFHCHNLEHEDGMMMRNFVVV